MRNLALSQSHMEYRNALHSDPYFFLFPCIYDFLNSDVFFKFTLFVDDNIILCKYIIFYANLKILTPILFIILYV